MRFRLSQIIPKIYFQANASRKRDALGELAHRVNPSLLPLLERTPSNAARGRKDQSFALVSTPVGPVPPSPHSDHGSTYALAEPLEKDTESMAKDLSFIQGGGFFVNVVAHVNWPRYFGMTSQ